MTRVLHLAGHNYKWNLESYIDHGIGDGIIFTAYSIPYQSYGKKLSGYKADLYKESSTIDLQFYGNKKSIGGKLSSYPFHPIHASSSSKTVIDGADQVEAAIKYQQNASIKNVIVPNFFYKDTLNTNKMLKRIHDRAMALKKKNEKFFMTLCFDKDLLLDELKIEYILQRATEMDIKFNGYYLVFENSVGYKQKISIDFKYYNNIYKILSTLKLQDFEVIVSYANFNALVFLSLCNIDYITIGTYENLRNFSIERFTEELSGGPSRGWFYSEKLLNFIKAEYIDFFRSKACANIIANDRNIFSNVILDDSFE